MCSNVTKSSGCKWYRITDCSAVCSDDQWAVRVVCITFWLWPITLSLTFRLHHIAVHTSSNCSSWHGFLYLFLFDTFMLCWYIHAVAFLPAMKWYFLCGESRQSLMPLVKKLQPFQCHLLFKTSSMMIIDHFAQYLLKHVHYTSTRSKTKQDYTIKYLVQALILQERRQRF